MPGSRPDVLDARTVLAALVAGVDPGREALARELAAGFPRERKMFDHWFTGDAAIHLVETLPPALAAILRPVALGWLDGTDRGPGGLAIARRLVELGDTPFLDALRARALGPEGRARYDAALLLLENGRAKEEDRARLLAAAWDEASGAGFWPKENFMEPAWHLRRLAELGAPGAVDALLEFARTNQDTTALGGWIALAGPIDAVRKDWPKAKDDPQAAAAFSRALLRAGGPEDRRLVLDALAARFDWGVLQALEATSPTAEEKARITEILKAHFANGGLPDRHPEDRGKSFLLGHKYGLPGMVEKIVAKAPWRDHVAALYDAGAKAEARKMAEAVLARCGASWEEDAIRERLGVAAQLAAHDPEAAKTHLGPILDEAIDRPTIAGALAFQTDAAEDVQLVRAAAASVLARHEEPDARDLLAKQRQGTFGWRRYRACAWSNDLFDRAELIAWFEKEITRVEHLDKMRGMSIAGYDENPTTADEQALLAATILRLDPSNELAARLLAGQIDSLEGRVLAEALRALSASTSAVTLDLEPFDPAIAAEVELVRARHGDEAAKQALEERLTSDASDRLVAAYALLAMSR